ncbi:amidohydrolase family protein [Klebsiella pneumoniae]|nr:amidohydrolase family protein [Klebsiella pneumoniae]
MLDVFEKVNRDIPFNGLHWFFDHAETITERNIERVKARWGAVLRCSIGWPSRANILSIATGKEAVKHTPPVAKMLALDVPVGLGTDATRVASYNPWTALYWLVSGRTVGGMAMWRRRQPPAARCRAGAVDGGQRLVLQRAGQERPSGRRSASADLVVLPKDYFSSRGRGDQRH